MSTAGIVILVILGVFLLLALGGSVVLRRRREAGASDFRLEIEAANRDLAEAHAADNGWDPERVTEAARQAFAEKHPDAVVLAVELVQVIDPPGTDDDKALFVITTPGGGSHSLTLGRHGDHWHLESLA